MSKLLIYFEGELLEERVLDRERITIGRKPGNDLQLTHSAVSGNHAMVTTIRNDSFLEDLNSTNGTKVNGKSIKKCLLRDGDEIRIAKHTLKYVFEPLEIKPDDESRRMEMQRQQAGQPRAEDDTLTTSDDSLMQTQSFASQPPVHGATTGRASAVPPLAGLRIMSGAGAGGEMELERVLTTLGKPGIQVAVITRRQEGYSLTYLEGEKKPLLNGVPIGEHPHTLKDRDIIEIAGIKLEFFLKAYSSRKEPVLR